MSISCPWCYKRVSLDDVMISGTCWTSRVQTCGKIIIKNKSSLVASIIEACEGIEVHGTIEGAIVSGGPVWIGPKARVKGSLKTAAIHVEKGGTIDGSFVQINSEKPVKGPSRPPMGMSPTLKPEHPIIKVLPWLKSLRTA
jgi:cytoskeletal protein CcmA (bactofilin family)